RQITRTVQQAAERSIDHVPRIVAEYLPPGSGAVDMLKDNNFGSLMRRHDAALREVAVRDGRTALSGPHACHDSGPRLVGGWQPAQRSPRLRRRGDRRA